MKSIQLLYCLLFICCSCTKPVQQSENYDVITIDKYENKYNTKGQLDTILITSTQEMYELSKLTSITANTSLHTYTYHNDSLYSISEINYSNKDVRKDTYYKDKSKETLTIRNNKDTIDYSLRLYRDHKEGPLDYERVIRRINGRTVANFIINDNYEERTFYNNDRRTKVIRHDFNNSQTEETYYFYDVTYKDALPSVPKSSNKQVIMCYSHHNLNDTLVEECFINGEPDLVVKKYKDKGKKIEYTYTPDGNETLFIEYKDGDMDITALNSSFMGNNSNDSTYTKKGKIIREAHISDNSKHLITYNYDAQGNLIKRITKIKLFD